MDLLTDQIRSYFQTRQWLNEASIPLTQGKESPLSR